MCCILCSFGDYSFKYHFFMFVPLLSVLLLVLLFMSNLNLFFDFMMK